MQAVVRIEELKSRFDVPYTRILKEVGIRYASFMRWKRRIAAGDPPLQSPGPKKIEPLDLDELKKDIGSLRHGRKRSGDTGRLYESYKNVISRRELNTMIFEVRRGVERDRVAGLNRVIWHRPDVAWTFDGTEYRTSFSNHKMYVQNLQDLCSRYKFAPMATEYMPCGEEVAGHLDRHFTRHGPPLFCNRDNGGNLNHTVVNQVLEDAMVIPVNSPVYTAPYNGAVEHAQGEVKQFLRIWDAKAKTAEGFTLLAETAAHDLNHKSRRSLGGRTACRTYFDGNRIQYTKRKRRRVFEWIRDLATDISHRAGLSVISRLAWRVAAKKWLEKNELLTILKPKNVSPYFRSFLCHN